jgi:hypothetical protein
MNVAAFYTALQVPKPKIPVPIEHFTMYRRDGTIRDGKPRSGMVAGWVNDGLSRQESVQQ